ncbi:hypothetical protein J1605_011166 [Eschrichtius robustus]|uniref:HTH CENPB-type domain-containing protein n=1 Tax=Eschrichtius robustus TaxID=9764 RepID=A0AB34GPS6_ESCRO|nr:hypothetical protein J1605_011166 [Eschrichtius robustus]
MQDQHQRQVLLSLMLIQEKAKSLYEDLKKKHGEESEGASFNASHGWFHQFKAKANLHNVKVTIVTMNGAWKNLCLKFVHDFCGFEKVDEESKKVFSNLVTLSKKLELDLQEDGFIELPAV